MNKNEFYINPRDEVSVKKAMIVGFIALGVLPVCLIITGICTSIYLEDQNLISNGQTGLAFLLFFVVGWLFWSIMVTKWKIWAYSRVKKIHKLKRLAIENQLIWPDGKWFNKTEIATKSQKEKLAKLEKRFNS